MLVVLLRSLGIDRVQYRTLLDLFSKLSEREEFQVGRAEIGRNIFVGMFAVGSALVNIVAVFGFHPDLHTFVTFNFLGTSLVLLLTVVREAVSTFLNPVEMSVLAHQPIRDRVYLAAKLT